MPTDLTVTAASATGISLSWTAPEGVDVRGYNVLRCEEGETPCTPEWLARVTAGAGDPPPGAHRVHRHCRDRGHDLPLYRRGPSRR